MFGVNFVECEALLTLHLLQPQVLDVDVLCNTQPLRCESARVAEESMSSSTGALVPRSAAYDCKPIASCAVQVAAYSSASQLEVATTVCCFAHALMACAPRQRIPPDMLLRIARPPAQSRSDKLLV